MQITHLSWYITKFSFGENVQSSLTNKVCTAIKVSVDLLDPQQQNNTQRFTTTTQYPKILHNNKRSSTTTEHPDIPLYPLQDILPLEFYNKNNALFCQLEDPVSSVESDRNIFCKLYWVN